MASMILPDTDILVDFLRGNPFAVSFISENADRVILSAIVVAELYAGVKGDAELSSLDNFVSLFRVVPVTAAIARAGGMYKNAFSKSHGVGLADAIIAATAESERAEIKTLNIKHYPMFKTLKPPYKK